MKKNLLLILIIICITFIFYNSFKNAEQSIKESGRVAGVIEKVVDIVYKGNPPEKVDYFFKITFGNVLRDSAHFFEFFILGILVILYSDKFKISVFRRFILVLLFCILIALLDETIQLFSIGRAFELSDLALDGSGSMAGSMLILLLWRIIKSKKYKKEEEYLKNKNKNISAGG